MSPLCAFMVREWRLAGQGSARCQTRSWAAGSVTSASRTFHLLSRSAGSAGIRSFRVLKGMGRRARRKGRGPTSRSGLIWARRISRQASRRNRRCTERHGIDAPRWRARVIRVQTACWRKRLPLLQQSACRRNWRRPFQSALSGPMPGPRGRWCHQRRRFR